MSYHLDFTAGAARQLRKLPGSVQDRLAPHLSALSDNPRPTGARKLKGTEGYRIRVGDYRILYEIHAAAARVLVVNVGHRREVYRKQ